MPDYTLSAKITGDANGFQSAISSAQKTLDNFSQKLDSAAKAFAPISAAVVGVGLASGKMALKFEDSMANVNTLLDDPSHLDGYENAVKRISSNTGLSLDSMSAGMYQAISSLGDGGVETEKIFNTMARSAKAGGAEVSDSVALISAGMKGYNSVSNETAQKISDLAFQTAKLGVTTFPEMAKSMQPLFPLASSLNISYEELFGSMATLTGVTGNTAEVSTQLKAVFSSLMAPTGSMQKLIEKYGYSSGQAMLEGEGLAGVMEAVKNETGGQADKMAELFSSTEAVTAMTAITGAQFDTFNDKLGQMTKATGATNTAYDKLITNGDIIRSTWNKIKNIGVDLGATLIDIVAPAIKAVGVRIDILSEDFSNTGESTRRFIVIIGAIVAAIAPALFLMSKLSGVASMMAKGLGMIANPVGLVIIAIAALAAGFVYLMKTNEAFREKVMGIWDAIHSKVSAAAEVILPIIQGIATKAEEVFSNLSSIIMQHIGSIPSKVGAVFSSVAPIAQKAFGKVSGIISAAVEKISPIAQTVSSQAAEAFSNFIPKVIPFFSSLPSKLSAVFSSIAPIAQNAFGKVVDVISAVSEKISPIVQGISSKAAESFSDFVPKVIPFISSLPSKIGTVFSSIGPMVKDAFSTVVDTVTAIFGPVISAVVPALQNFKTVIMDTFNQVKTSLSGDGLGGSNIILTIMGMIMGLNPVVKLMIQVFSQIAPQIGNTFKQLIAIIGPVIAQIITMAGTLISNVVPILITGFQTIAPIISQVIGTISSTIASFLPVVVSIIQSIVQAIGTLLPVIMNIATTLIPVISQIIQTVLPVVGQIIGMIGSLISQLAPFIALLVGQLGPIITTIASVISNLVSAVLPVIISLINLIMSTIQTMMPVIMTIINVVMQVATNIISVIISVVSTILAALSPILSFIGMLITNIISTVAPIISFIANLIATVISVIQPIITIVSGIITTLVNVVGSIFRGILTIVTNIFSGVTAFISSAINTVSGIISTVSGVVSGVFNKVYSTVSGIMDKVSRSIKTVFDGIKSAWNGLTSFVSGVFSGVANAVDGLVSQVKGFVNGVIGGINSAIDLINLIPGVSIGYIPYLLHGTDDWQGGFARMNEGGRGELTYLPDGTQVIPHDISMKYAKEAAKAKGVGTGNIDLSGILDGVTIQIMNHTSVDGTPLRETCADYTIKKIGDTQKAVLKARGCII